MNKKKLLTIAFILPENGFPVPAICGGAIETLMTMLLEENERNGCFRFVFFCDSGKTGESRRIGYEHGVCYYRGKPSKEKKEPPELFKKVYGKCGRYALKWFPNTTAYYREAAKAVARERADYVLAEGGVPNCYSAFLRKLDRDRIVIHLHHYFAAMPLYSRIFGKTLAVSQFLAEEWEKNGGTEKENIFLWKNCVDAVRFQKVLTAEERAESRNTLGYTHDDFVVLFCGRIIEIKGVIPLIQAVLSVEDSAVKLLLIGSSDFARGNQGDYAEKVAELVKKNGRRIRHIGYIPNEKLARYYQSADIEVIPSLCQEAAGLVALEGALSGLPLIVTRSGGLVEYVDTRYTEVVEQDDQLVRHLAEKISALKADSTRRRIMAEGAYRNAAAYTKERYYKEFTEIVGMWEKE